MKTIKTMRMVGLLIVVAVGLSGCRDAAAMRSGLNTQQLERGLILQRLEQAQEAQARAADALSPLDRELVFFADFEQDDTVYLGNNVFRTVEFAPSHYRAGRHGRGFYFEKPRANLLPPELADVETQLDGFEPVGGATLASVETDTAFGKRALQIDLPDVGDGVRIRPVEVSWTSKSWHEKTWTLLASCYVKGARGTRLTIDVQFEPASTNEMVVTADTYEPQTVVLNGEWQRIACTATADIQLRQRRAVLLLHADAPLTGLLADGFQVEQANYYPHSHRMPTTWTPGGSRHPATSVRMGSPVREAFPVEEGAVAFWALTPRTSNLPEPGNIYWFSFGTGWNPGWQLSTGAASLPGGTIRAGRDLRHVCDGSNWHHVAFGWSSTNATLYVDGHPVGTTVRSPYDLAPTFETFSLVLGGSFSSAQTANSVLDDIAVFKRPLTDVEVAALAKGQTLRAIPGSLSFSQGRRSVYYRDEKQAEWTVDILSLASTNQVLKVDFAIGDVIAASQVVTVKPGVTSVPFPFVPGHLKCGDYAVQVGALEKNLYYAGRVEIVPALRRDHYTLSSWGAGGETAVWRAFCRDLGLNTIDTYGENIEQLGREGFFYNWHYNFGDGVASPENREAVREATRKSARQRAVFPNWRSTLLNSEVSVRNLPDAAARQAWFDAWAEKELGFSIPTNGWRFGTSHNPVTSWFVGDEQPGSNGVYRASRGFSFLKWWYNRGAGWWRLNAEAASVIHQLRPDVHCWTDPLRYPGQIADLDGGSTWSYQLTAEPLIGDFETSYASVRGSGKAFYGTLGMNYVKQIATNVQLPDGTTNNLVPTADDMIQQAWIVVTQIPSEGLTYWSMNSLFNGLQKTNTWYAEPDSATRLGAVLKQDLLPVGTLLKQAPNAQRPLALLLPESTLWPCAGEGRWGWGTTHYPNAWRNWIGAMGLPYDVLRDHDVTPGTLAKYRAIIFPMAEYVSEPVYREVLAAAQAGTEIVVDQYCRQEYPNMTRLDQAYYHRMRDKKPYAALVEATEQFLAELKTRLVPQLDVYAVGEAGPVIFNVREAAGVRYVSVINNHRREGPYSQWTTNTFKPYGVAQRADIYLRLPEGGAVYELTQSKRLPLQREGDYWKTTVDLPPHAGRLLCLYPAPLKRISINSARRVTLGSAADLHITLQDKRKHPLSGWQLLDVEIRDPTGRIHDASGLYRATSGEASIPFRPALNAATGTWRVVVLDKASGIRQAATIRVVAQRNM